MAKRKSGYAVTITAFVPVDPENLEEQQKVLDAMKALKDGNPAPLLGVAPAKYLNIKSKSESRQLED